MNKIKISALPFALMVALASAASNLAHAADTSGRSQVSESSAAFDVWVTHAEQQASGDQPSSSFTGEVKTDSVFLQMRDQSWTWGLAVSQAKSSFVTPDNNGRRGETITSAIPYVVWQATPLVSINGYLGLSEGSSRTLQSPMGPVAGARDSRAVRMGLGGTVNVPLSRGLLTPTVQYARSDARYDAYSQTRTFDDGSVTSYPNPGARVTTDTVSYGARYTAGFGNWTPHVGLMGFNRVRTNIEDEARHWAQSTVGLRYTFQPKVQFGVEHKQLLQHKWEQGSTWVISANFGW